MRGPRGYVTDLSHLLDAEGRLVEGAVGGLARYLSALVELGSVLEVGYGRRGPARCVNPTRRRRCGGTLLVGRRSRSEIDWECARCGEHGLTHGWRGTRFDLGRARPLGPLEEAEDAVVPEEELFVAMLRVEGSPALRRRLADAYELGDGYAGFRAEYGALLRLRDLASEAAGAARGDYRRQLDRFAARMDAARTACVEFYEPLALDLEALAAEGTPREVLALAREIAAEQGRDAVFSEDLRAARQEHHRGRRPVLH